MMPLHCIASFFFALFWSPGVVTLDIRFWRLTTYEHEVLLFPFLFVLASFRPVGCLSAHTSPHCLKSFGLTYLCAASCERHARAVYGLAIRFLSAMYSVDKRVGGETSFVTLCIILGQFNAYTRLQNFLLCSVTTCHYFI
jgi:hypothetical protein